MRDWVTNVRDTHYSSARPSARTRTRRSCASFQSVIGDEARAQMLAERPGALPDAVVACVGGGSNAIGIFRAFIDDAGVALIGVEAGGEGIASGQHGASLGHGRPGVLHGTRSYVLQDADGQIAEPHSISAGLDYPGVGPEHAYLRTPGGCAYASADRRRRRSTAFQACSRSEGIIPALESSHALALVAREAAAPRGRGAVLVCLSGRGDKDVDAVGQALGLDG